VDGTAGAPHRHPSAPESVAKRFAELVCADADWLRAEFDAIVAANFPAGELPAPRVPRGRRPVGTVGADRAVRAAHRAAASPHGIDRRRPRARERGPPDELGPIDGRKG
jgi:hypothetical protein